MKVAQRHWLKSNFLEIILTVLVVILFIGSLFYVYADASTMVGIQLSKSCEASINCPSYEELVDIYDNTNQYYSGFFGYNDLGQFQRQTANYKNHWLLYSHPTQFVFAVDPQKEWIRYLDYYIVLEPSHFTYFDRSDRKIENNTLTQYNDRYIENCANARIYYELIQDTLNYLLSNCKVTKFNSTQLIYHPPLPVNLADHKWYQYAEWMKQAQLDCKTKC